MNVYRYAEIVSDLKPGFAITIAREELKEIRSIPLLGPFGPEWDAVQQIMEKVIGSAYSIRTYNDPMTGNVTFMRLKNPLRGNRRTYVSPDRIDLFTRDVDGLYTVKA